MRLANAAIVHSKESATFTVRIARGVKGIVAVTIANTNMPAAGANTIRSPQNGDLYAIAPVMKMQNAKPKISTR